MLETQTRPADLDRRVAEIMALNLSLIKAKIMDPEEGKGWDQERADLAELWYRRFLVLNLKYPEKKVVPVADMDDFWHQHILDTRAYAADCERVFGYFLHHYPYFGMQGDREELESSFDESIGLFEREFGESPLSLSKTASKCSKCSRCRNCGGTH